MGSERCPGEGCLRDFWYFWFPGEGSLKEVLKTWYPEKGKTEALEEGSPLDLEGVELLGRPQCF